MLVEFGAATSVPVISRVPFLPPPPKLIRCSRVPGRHQIPSLMCLFLMFIYFSKAEEKISDISFYSSQEPWFSGEAAVMENS